VSIKDLFLVVPCTFFVKC